MWLPTLLLSLFVHQATGPMGEDAALYPAASIGNEGILSTISGSDNEIDVATTRFLATVDKLCPFKGANPPTIEAVEKAAQNPEYIEGFLLLLAQAYSAGAANWNISGQKLDAYVKKVESYAGPEIRASLERVQTLNTRVLEALGSMRDDSIVPSIDAIPELVASFREALADLSIPLAIRNGFLQGMCAQIYVILVDSAANRQINIVNSKIADRLRNSMEEYCQAVASYASLDAQHSEVSNHLSEFVDPSTQQESKLSKEISSYARHLAEEHFATEINLELIAAFLSQSREAILLVEVNPDTIRSGFSPIGFRSTSPYLRRVVIADVTPDEWVEYGNGTFKLEGNWGTLPPSVYRRNDFSGGGS